MDGDSSGETAHDPAGSTPGETRCEGPAVLVHDPSLVAYDFGAGHPMSPVRIDLTVRLAEALGVVGPEGLRVVTAQPASDELLRTVHTAPYVEAVRRAGESGASDLRFGIGTDDNPAFRGMHDAAAHVVGSTVEACRLVHEGEVLHAASIAGGLHHAMPGHAAGFCVYNDVAVGIRWLLDHGVERVAYVDVDVHHGDGVEKVFWDDPRVLTVSLHETGRMLFPGTGDCDDLGGPGAEGTAVNLPLPPGTGDAGWLRAFHAVVPALVRAFAPEVIVTQHGCDSHAEDPLAHLMLSVDGQRAAHDALHALAHEVSDGRWVATGGGGYALVEVVPRSWTHLLAMVDGRPLDPATAVPGPWRERVEEVFGLDTPARMTDGRTPTYRPWEGGHDLDSLLDAAVQATREAAFALHGLDPGA